MTDGIIKNHNLGLSKSFGVQELSDLLEKAARENGRENKFTKKVSFAPSGIGYGSGTCPRYWYYAFNGADFVYDASAQQIAMMDAGTAAGERIAKLLDHAGILVEAEKPVRHEDPPIGGFIDAIVDWKGEEVVVEVKTTNDTAWNYRFTQMKVPGYQLIQLLIYMRVEKKDKGFFIVENKNDHGWLVVPIKMNDELNALTDYIFEWMRTTKANADEGKLPTRPFTPKSKQCKSCPVWDTCWAGYKRGSVNGTDPAPGEITLLPLEVPK